MVGRIDLPNTDEVTALIKKCIEAVAIMFEDDLIGIDRTVHNAARIWKLYGTRACKGDHTAERPHRLSQIVQAPHPLKIIPLEKLQQLAALAKEEPKQNPGATNRRTDFDIDTWVANSGLDVAFSGNLNGGGRKWVLETCPWNSDHINRSAVIIERVGGALSARCLHNGCTGKGWHDLRNVVEPGWDKKRSDHASTIRNEAATTGTSVDAYPYGVEAGRIVRYQTVKENNTTVSVPLCNFDAQIKEEVVLDDGADPQRAFVIEGRLDTKAILPLTRVAVARFPSMNWVGESWGRRAIVNAGNSTKDHLRVAIQKLSPNARDRYIFTHTGWRKIGSQWIYLSGSTTGNDDFEVDIGSELARYALPSAIDDRVEAMKLSLELLDLAPYRISAPLFAACYRAPLCGAYPQDLSIWLEGRTGSMKSALAALYLNHFGEFSRITLPGNWESTANQLERRAFLLKDNLFVIDEYVPNRLNRREIETKASRILRGQGNLSGRNRLKSDLTERPAFYPRGIIQAPVRSIPQARACWREP